MSSADLRWSCSGGTGDYGCLGVSTACFSMAILSLLCATMMKVLHFQDGSAATVLITLGFVWLCLIVVVVLTMNSPGGLAHRHSARTSEEAMAELEEVDELFPAICVEGFPTCAVCLAEVGQEEVCRVLPCKHCFHVDCLDRWWRGSRTRKCPLCRFDYASVAAGRGSLPSRDRHGSPGHGDDNLRTELESEVFYSIV
eukprot:TRINITY_DN94792_c0_g1_i1.p1 TRINITY_DN94792_c0_g1~~TRINITY_DN94792_c0_g1_i1.p1  ORF type:complete len:198 (+),score=28.25 TRINITY_DN94792_c0_g1_i1:73-666(+)